MSSFFFSLTLESETINLKALKGRYFIKTSFIIIWDPFFAVVSPVLLCFSAVPGVRVRRRRRRSSGKVAGMLLLRGAAKSYHKSAGGRHTHTWLIRAERVTRMTGGSECRIKTKQQDFHMRKGIKSPPDVVAQRPHHRSVSLVTTAAVASITAGEQEGRGIQQSVWGSKAAPFFSRSVLPLQQSFVATRNRNSSRFLLSNDKSHTDHKRETANNMTAKACFLFDELTSVTSGNSSSSKYCLKERDKQTGTVQEAEAVVIKKVHQ